MDEFPASPLRHLSGGDAFHEDHFMDRLAEQSVHHSFDSSSHVSNLPFDGHSTHSLPNQSHYDHMSSQPFNQMNNRSSVMHQHVHFDSEPTPFSQISLSPVSGEQHHINESSNHSNAIIDQSAINQSISHSFNITQTQAGTQSSDASPKSSVRESVKRTSRRKQNIACLVCYVAKTSCDGHRPCARCVRLDKQCRDRASKFVYNPSISQSPNQPPSQLSNPPNSSNDQMAQSISVASTCSDSHMSPTAYSDASVSYSFSPSQPFSSSLDQRLHQSNTQSSAELSPYQHTNFHQRSPRSDCGSDFSNDHMDTLFADSHIQQSSPSSTQSLNQSLNQSDSDSDEEYDPRSHNLLNPRFHRRISRAMCDVQLTWFAEQMSNNSHLSSDPFQMNGLFGKLVYWHWMAAIMLPDELARVLHDTTVMGKERPEIVALSEMEALKSVNQSINQSQQLVQHSDYQSCFVKKSTYQAAFPSSHMSAYPPISQTITQTVTQSFHHIKQSPHHPSSKATSNRCRHATCNQLCASFYEWFELNPCAMTYFDSPDQAINQSVNQSITPSPQFDYPVMVETLINIEELSSESTWQRLLENTLTPPDSQSFKVPFPVRLSLSVNPSFERLFGFSQRDIRNMALQHNAKVPIALARSDYWREMLMKEQDANFARTNEYMMSMVCVTKWGGEVYCLKHTKFVCDDLGRYKEYVSLFIPLDQSCPPYRKQKKNKNIVKGS